MKTLVDQAAAAFIEEMAEVPDQVLQQATFRLKQRVKGLHQVVSDLELPLASVLCLELETASRRTSSAVMPLQQKVLAAAHQEQTQQHQAVQTFTQVCLKIYDRKICACSHFHLVTLPLTYECCRWARSSLQECAQ